MSDLIDRRAALAAVEYFTELDRVDVRYVLSDLPSAQPEIIRCKECEDYQTDWETSYPNEHYCAVMDKMMPADGFCSSAERREE